MKKVLLSLAILFASLSMYANGEVTESYEITNDEPVEILIREILNLDQVIITITNQQGNLHLEQLCYRS